MSRNKITQPDLESCHSLVGVQEYIGLYLSTDVRSHALIVALWFAATLLNYLFALQACSVHVAKC